MFPKQLLEQLEQKKQTNQFRSLKVNPKEFADFWSNDYLGASHQLKTQNSNLKINFKQPTTNDQRPITNNQQQNFGSTGSRLISGNSKEVEELEQYLSQFYNAEAALIFNSGYMANLSVLSCIPQKNDVVFYDEYIHASMRDGIRLGNAKSYSFQHQNLNDLEQKLQKFGKATNYIAVESLYSMDGDILNLNRILEIAERYNAYLILDEAHGTGVLGENYKGLFELNNHQRILARIHTFGKALGSHGAVIVGSNDLRDFLINYARPFIYTTALPYSSLNEIRLVHQIFKDDKESKIQLKENIQTFNDLVKKLKLSEIVSQNQTPIQSIFGSIEWLKHLESKLEQEKFAVKAILSPTVPKGKERIRICLHSFNTKEEINQLLSIIKECQ